MSEQGAVEFLKQHPLLLVQTADVYSDSTALVDGWHRLFVSRGKGLPELPAVVARLRAGFKTIYFPI
jgi:hypothetical protein